MGPDAIKVPRSPRGRKIAESRACADANTSVIASADADVDAGAFVAAATTAAATVEMQQRMGGRVEKRRLVE